jgi:CYTH domain-containing protein
MIEREKRWKLKANPPADKIIDKFIIEQTYATNNSNPSVRIRKITRDNSEEYSHCVKYNLSKTNEREEVEQKISKERYNRIFEVIDKKPIIKERTIVEIGDNLFAEIDYFNDTQDIVIEVEFPSIELMNSFHVPDWFGAEIKENSFSYSLFRKINNINVSIWD